jgi:iron complex outermembrane recepter protein
MTKKLKRGDENINVSKRTQLKPLAVAVIAACTASGFPTPVFAQLEEVMVTAQRRSESIQDIPYNISAFSSDQLESSRAFDIGDVSRLVPGLAYKDQGGSFRSSRNTFTLRGLNANDARLIFGTDVSSGAVSMYFGETPLFFPLTMKDIERVEVLRGPQGTLYGSGSLGGTIRFIPKEASLDGFAIEVNGHVDSMSESDDLSYGTDFMVNIPLIENSLALRVVASWEDKAGFIDAVGLVRTDASGQPIASVPGDPTSGYILAPEEDTNESEAKMARISLNWAPTDEFGAKFTYLNQTTEVDDFSGANPSNEGGLFDASLGRYPGAKFENPNGCQGGVAFQAYFPIKNTPCAGPGGATLYANSGTTLPDVGDYEHSSFKKSPGESKVDLYSLELKFELPFATLTSATSYSEVSFDNSPDFTGFDLPNRSPTGTSVGTFSGFYPRMLGLTTSSDETDRLNQEFRLSSVGDNNIDWVVGAYYEDRESRGSALTIQPGLSEYDLTVNVDNGLNFFGPFPLGQNHFTLPDTTFVEDRTFEFEDIAVFGEVTWHVNEQWQITGGARAFWQEFTHEFEQLVPFCGTFCSTPTDPNFTLGGTTLEPITRDFEDQIFKINTSYDINDETMAYFTWAEGFRHGGTNALATSGRNASLDTFLEFEPDDVTNWEVGIKGNLGDSTAYSLAFFLVEWNNYQFEFFNTAGFKTVLNGDEAQTQGIELELNGVIGEGLSYNIGYSYIDAEATKDFIAQDYSSGEGSPIVDIVAIESGDPLPNVPDHTLTAAIDYDYELSNSWTLGFHIDGRYASDTQSGFNENINFGRDFFKIDSYTVFNAALNLDSNERWRASLFVRNIGNEQNLSAGNTAPSAGGAHAYFFSMAPRTVGLSFSYRYE